MSMQEARGQVVIMQPELGGTRGPSRRQLERALSVGSPVALLAMWEGAAWLGKIDTRFFPAPSGIFQEFLTLLQGTELLRDVGVTLSRLAIGFLIGAIPGILIGLAVGLFGPVRAIVSPLVDAIFPIPKIAILPLFLMIFGLGETSKYAIVAVAVIFLVLINTASGVRNIDRIFLDVARNYNAGRMMVFWDIALPGALPSILTGLKLGMGIALVVIISAEFVGAQSGIGYMIWSSWQTLQVEKMYVGLMVISVVGFVAAMVLTLLERVLMPWKRGD